MQADSEGAAGAPTRWAPAELNALSAEALRDKVLAAWHPTPDDHGVSRAPLLAPFITNGILRRVRDILIPVVPENGYLAALGYSVAALTGAPQPVCRQTAGKLGQLADTRINDCINREKRLGKPSEIRRSAWKRERQKQDDENLFVERRHGGTPPAPSDDLLHAGLPDEPPAAPAPPPVGTVPVPMRVTPQLYEVQPGQRIYNEEQVQQLMAKVESIEGSEREMGMLTARAAAVAEVQAKRAAELEAERDAEAKKRKRAEDAVVEEQEKTAAAEKAARDAAVAAEMAARRIGREMQAYASLQRKLEKMEAQHCKERREMTEAEMKKMEPEVRAKVEQEMEEKVARTQRLKNDKAAELRAIKLRLETAEGHAEQRLERAKAAEERADELRSKVDELQAELDQLRPLAARAEAAPELAATRSAKGRFSTAPYQLRVLVWGQLARRTPPSAVGANTVDAARIFAPGLLVQEPSREQVGKMRLELAIAGEALAAYQLAGCKRIRCFGFDETTKLQTGLLSTNVQAQMPDGSDLNIVLQGALIIPGGTAEQVAAAVETRVFGRARLRLEGWIAVYEEMHGAGTWPGPRADAVGLQRLGGGALIMSDTCNGARAAKRLLLQRIAMAVAADVGPEAWDKLSQQDRERVARAHSGDCMQHLRNIFLDAMSAAASAHLKVKLEDSLAEFMSFERMTTDCSALIRAIYKELHHEGDYAKGKGKEFAAWLKKNFPSAFYVQLERAPGSRQDLSFDGAVPIYASRVPISKFLQTLVYQPDHANVLEDFLWHALGCSEMVASLRAHTLVDLLISRPLRWLSGKSAQLNDWSIYSMAGALDLVEQVLVRVAADGNVLLDPSLDIFKPIADTQPLFAKWRKECEEETVASPDGKTKHAKWARVLAEARTPQNASNAASKDMTVELLEVMAQAALLKFHDPKLALANKLTSQDGANSQGKNAVAHAETAGAYTTNCAVESNFGCYDYVLRTFGVSSSVQAISAVAQQMRMHHFDVASTRAHNGQGHPEERQLGAFHALPEKLQRALVEYARRELAQSRKTERADKAEQDEYRAVRRAQNLEKQLEKVVDQYVDALNLYEEYRTPGNALTDKNAVAAKLDAIKRGNKQPAAARGADDEGPQAPQKAFLRRQIEMRVVGLGWTQFATPWSSTKDKAVGSVPHLQRVLEEIIIYEKAQRRLGRIPTEAAVPVMKKKSLKQLGTATCDAQELAAEAIFSVEEVRLAGVAEQARRDEALEGDAVQRQQPADAPALDATLVGKRLEICWKYFSTEEGTEGEARLIWCSGEVTKVADGTSDKKSKKCKKMLPSGAVLIKWPEDKDRGEKESLSWCILIPSKWNKDCQNAWRFDPRDAPCAAPAAPPPARPAWRR